MRLAVVEQGHRWRERMKLALMDVVSGGAPDVIKTLLYRPEIFGAAANEVFQAALRGPSEWSVGERELFASFVSSRNQCVF